MDGEHEQFKARIEHIYRNLDHYSYYELLRLSPDAGPDDIRAAFHRLALTLHPDRHHADEDEDLREMVGAVYRRICEGYRVLMEARSRKEYDRLLSEGQHRLVSRERKKSGPARVEETIGDPQARKFFLLGQDAETHGDLKGARLNYSFALRYEADSALILERLRQVEERLGKEA